LKVKRTWAKAHIEPMPEASSYLVIRRTSPLSKDFTFVTDEKGALPSWKAIKAVLQSWCGKSANSLLTNFGPRPVDQSQGGPSVSNNSLSSAVHRKESSRPSEQRAGSTSSSVLRDSNLSQEALDFDSQPIRPGPKFAAGIKHRVCDLAGLGRSLRNLSHARGNLSRSLIGDTSASGNFLTDGILLLHRSTNFG
jgi:hypothetical protein